MLETFDDSVATDDAAEESGDTAYLVQVTKMLTVRFRAMGSCFFDQVGATFYFLVSLRSIPELQRNTIVFPARNVVLGSQRYPRNAGFQPSPESPSPRKIQDLFLRQSVDSRV